MRSHIELGMPVVNYRAVQSVNQTNKLPNASLRPLNYQIIFLFKETSVPSATTTYAI